MTVLAAWREAHFVTQYPPRAPLQPQEVPLQQRSVFAPSHNFPEKKPPRQNPIIRVYLRDRVSKRVR
jgi:hypothetical protein